MAEKICSIEDCNGKATRRGWCGKHYDRWRRHGDPNAYMFGKDLRCTVDGCDRSREGRGYCSKHYQRFMKHGDPKYVAPKPECQIDGCERKHTTQGYCAYHWYRLQKYGDPTWERTYKHELQADEKPRLSRKTGLDFSIPVPHELTPELEEAFQSLPKRIRDKIDHGEGCWEWKACRDKHGYGRASRGKEGGHVVTNAHRFVYELAVGDPGDDVIDHLCRNHPCVRPDHLEAVPSGENTRRGRGSNHSGLCRSGRHEWTMENIIQDGEYRRCRPCRDEKEAARIRRSAA